MLRLLKNIVVRILTWEAKHVLKRYKPFVIAVTGSVGKTGTKDAIFQVVYASANAPASVRKSQKSFNSELGIPLTVLGLENAWRNPWVWLANIFKGFLLVMFPGVYPKILVLEVGADHPGDIKRVCEWLKPDIAVVTSLPDRPVHVEYFPSPDDLKREKALLVRALDNHGIFVANADDPSVISLAEETRARMLTYGFGDSAEVRGTKPEIHYEEREGREIPVGMKFNVDWQGNSFPVELRGVLGTPSSMAALAAIAVGLTREFPLTEMTNALSMLPPPSGRMRIIAGQSGSTIIDDTYNSSPIALESALLTLKNIKANHRIAMLGDMLELGEYSDEEHLKMGRIAGGFVDELITVGKRARGIALAARTAGLPEEKIHRFSNSLEAGEWVRDKIKTGDVILAKGSQGSGENMIRMERAVSAIMAHPEDASKLLVRQEAEWQKQYN